MTDAEIINWYVHNTAIHQISQWLGSHILVCVLVVAFGVVILGAYLAPPVRYSGDEFD